MTLAAFVLSTWMTVLAAGGIARADSPPPSGGESTSEGKPGVKPAGPPGTTEASTSESSKRSGGLHNRAARLFHLERPDQTTNSVKTKRTTKPSPRTPASDPKDPDEATGNTAAHVDSTTAVANAAPRDEQVRHRGRRVDLALAAVKPAKPVSADPQRTSAGGVTNYRSALALEPQRSVQAQNPKPVAANIAPANPAAPSTRSSIGATDVPQLGRQVVGLVSDVGVVASSAVYTVANTFANAFGPGDFLGVPYALATALANTAAAAGRTMIGAPLDAASPGRFPVTYGVLDGLAFFNPRPPPPGANDPKIKVTPEHPLPIILLNGTTATQGTNWSVGAPVLANAGYKVYTFNYGNITQNPNSPIQATADIRQSGDELAAEVDRVLKETGAKKVILIGHSQGGGILPAYYINNLDGADKVSQVIGIAPSNHGTDFNGLVGLRDLPVLGPALFAIVDVFGPAFGQQTVGSEFQQEVYGNGDTRPGVMYTTIATRYDEIVTPYTQQALDGPNVTNIVIQDLYPGLTAGHLGVVLSPQVWSVVLDALASNPEANPELHPLDSVELAA